MKIKIVVTNILAGLYFKGMTFILFNALFWAFWFIPYMIKIETTTLQSLAIITLCILSLILLWKGQEDLKELLRTPLDKLIEYDKKC